MAERCRISLLCGFLSTPETTKQGQVDINSSKYLHGVTGKKTEGSQNTLKCTTFFADTRHALQAPGTLHADTGPLSRKRLEIPTWRQWTTYRKWPPGYQMVSGHVTDDARKIKIVRDHNVLRAQ